MLLAGCVGQRAPGPEDERPETAEYDAAPRDVRADRLDTVAERPGEPRTPVDAQTSALVPDAGARADTTDVAPAGQMDGSAAPVELGQSPSGSYRAEPVPGSPTFSAAQVVWWRDSLIIGDHGDGGRLVRYTPPSSFETFARIPGPFGVAVAPDGDLVVAAKTPNDPGTSRILRVRSDGSVSKMIEGPAAIAPQHVVVHRSGRVFWTNFDKPTVLSLSPGGAPVALAPGVGHSYGIALSPLHDHLYVSSKLPGSSKGWVYRFPLAPDGTPAGEGVRLFTTLMLTAPAGDALDPYIGRLQGITVDARGNIYFGGAEARVSGKESVGVVDPLGKKVIAIIRSQHNVIDVAFGDADLRTLYITGNGPGTLYRVRLPVAGLPQ